MGLELKQNLQLRQQLALTPQLQQAIKLLQMSRFELEQFVSSEIAENPLLEMESSQSEHEASPTKESYLTEEQKEEEPIWAKAREEYRQEPSTKKLSSVNAHGLPPHYENMSSSLQSLQEHLLRQLGEQELTEEEKKAALILVGYLDEKGFLDEELEKICAKEVLSYDVAEGVLDLIQRLEPKGVGAKNLQESLLLQLRGIKHPKVIEVVKDHFELLEQKKYQQIAKKLKLNPNEFDQVMEIISRLSPNPGSAFGGPETIYILPDVYVAKVATKWVVYLNEDGLSQLKINDHYRSLLARSLNPKEKAYFQEKHKAASWLVKSLHQRQRTIYRVTEKIVEKQQEFFERGTEHLKPLILKDVAEELGLHESTISRVTTNKYVHTPRGLFELKYFFNNSITSHGEALASEAVKSLIKNMIDEEDPSKPLSDQKIVELLRVRGVVLARRTVAKYREQMGLLTSSQRRLHER